MANKSDDFKGKRAKGKRAKATLKRVHLPELDVEGTALVTGAGDVGQLGLGPDIVKKSRPTAIAFDHKVVATCSGGMHTVCLTKEGKDIMTSKLEKTIAELLCCPCCLSYMYPPINQCLDGHNICHKCYSQVLTCPTCRESKSVVVRNYALEAIFSISNLPCKYNNLGCDYISVGEKIRNHEDYCWYKKNKCPFATCDTCPWIDSMFNLRNHLLKSHSKNFSEGRKIHFTLKDFKGISGCNHCIVAVTYIYGKFFSLTFKLEKSSKMTVWGVYFMGSPEEVSNYSYKLEILSGAETTKESLDLILFQTVCAPKSENEVNDINQFGDDNCCYIPKPLLENKYCKTNGELNCVVTIYKKIAKDQKSTSTKSDAGMVQSEEIIEVSDYCQEISSVKVEIDKSCH